MSGLIGRGLAVCTALLAAYITPAAADQPPFDALAVQDPAEAAAPADASFTAACQRGARERFGQERPSFGRSRHTALGDTGIVRMDVTVAGEPFRAVCTRDRAGGEVETVVFAGPGDQAGPRVIVLGGPPQPRPPTPSTESRIILRDPSRGSAGDDYPYQGYSGDYLPGIWFDTVPDRFFSDRVRRACRDCRVAIVNGSRVIIRSDGTVVATVRPQFVERVPGSSAPFSTGGTPSPGISSFPNPVAQGQVGGMASPGISNFPSRIVRGGNFGFRGGGGGRAAIGSFRR